MNTRSPTIKDVAARAGLSAGTVSRYLNKSLILPDDTAQRIEGAVTDLGYRPNAMARRLSKGRTEMLGFATTDIAYPVFAAIASAAEAEAEARGYGLAVYFTRNKLEKELSLINKIEDQHVDGLILRTNHVDDGRLREAISQTGRVVLIDEDIDGVAAPRIFADSVRGTSLATKHLVDQGHRRIAFIGGQQELLSSQERFEGFRQVMAAEGFPIDGQMVKFGSYHEWYGIQAFEELWQLPSPPTAIVVAADLLALGVMRAANAKGVSIPDHLSIIGFDDLDMASLLAPPLTTVRQSPEEFGRRAVAALVNLIEGGEMPATPDRVAVELIVRGSVAAPRNGNGR
ncbi:LacI family DNA-binding transcriptional regulator [Brucella anthropi]|uniref:LacI family DNA-binding transcriptional regulator n=1 Tax=Brucella anthropi TaxID=529 RepID=UPI0015F0ECD6|nr:LacI family DNA-binding transcriptional regulator [Brucella anthropi]